MYINILLLLNTMCLNLINGIQDCSNIYTQNNRRSGVHRVYWGNGEMKHVKCDMDTMGGRWTIIQERGSKDTVKPLDFYRPWNDYRNGFGDPRVGDFWLGLKSVHDITSGASLDHELLVQLTDQEGVIKTAVYSKFKVQSESSRFSLVINGFSGPESMGDSLSYHTYNPFSTRDRDNDRKHGDNCARLRKGGWWFNSCGLSNLNGVYYNDSHAKSRDNTDGIIWSTWHGQGYSLKASKMMIRPKGDICTDSPCRNGGNCQVINEFTRICKCVKGYTDINCGTDINECESSPCLNNGTCRDQLGSFFCDCTTSYRGQICSIENNPCEAVPCHHGSSCQTISPSEYKCNCTLGYDGVDCQHEIDECASNVCENGATCTDHLSYFTCKCTDKHWGEYCQYDINECEMADPCANEGSCVNTYGGFICNCQTGYTGDRCTQDIAECASQPCQNNAPCLDQLNGYLCMCNNTGFFGVHCHIDVNDCGSSPCLNNGTCLDKHLGYDCRCQPGYLGKDCEYASACTVKQPCGDNGVCVPNGDSYFCICKLGFSGPTCQQVLIGGIYQKQGKEKCYNGGQYVSYGHIDIFKCICPHGTFGELCQIDTRDSKCGVCHNGDCMATFNPDDIALLNTGSGSVASIAVCQCHAGWAGDTCQLNVSNLTPVTLPTTTFLSINDSEIGDTTRSNFFEVRDINSNQTISCQYRPCFNGGKCIIYNHTRSTDNKDYESNSTYNTNEELYICQCPLGTKGVLCEIEIGHLCGGKICPDPFQCIDVRGRFHCIKYLSDNISFEQFTEDAMYMMKNKMHVIVVIIISLIIIFMCLYMYLKKNSQSQRNRVYPQGEVSYVNMQPAPARALPSFQAFKRVQKFRRNLRRTSNEGDIELRDVNQAPEQSTSKVSKTTTVRIEGEML